MNKDIKELELHPEEEYETIQRIIAGIPAANESDRGSAQSSIQSSAQSGVGAGSSSRTSLFAKYARENLYKLVVDELSNGTRSNKEQLGYLEVLEQALSVFRVAALELRKEMDVLTLEQRVGMHLQVIPPEKKKDGIGDDERYNEHEDGKVLPLANKETQSLQRQISDLIFFSNRYALYFAGQVGLALLNSEPAKVENRFSFGTKYDSSKDRDDLTSRLAKVVQEDLQRVLGDKSSRQEKLSDEDLKYTLEAVFTSWSNQFQWGTFAELGKSSGIEKVKLRWKGYSVQAGEFKKSYDTIVVDEKFMKAKRDDVIGNEDYKTQVWQSLLRLAGYDFEHQDNPFSPPGVIFTYGAPGGGKTMTAHALIRSFAEEICAKQKIPFWAFTHSITDFGSKYQNETPQQLAAIRDKVRDFPGLVVMYASDVDTIFTSRKSDNTSNEENKVSGVYFSFFDGSMIPRNGRFLAIMDANYVDGIDDATKSRVFDKIIELKRFQTAVEFAEYSRRYLSRGEQLGVKDEEWQEIGKYLLDSPLSNREISNILKNLQGDFNVTEEMLGKGREEKLAFRRDYLRGITKDMVIGRCDDFINTKMQIERASYEAKKGQDLEKYLTALATEAEKTAKDTGAA